MEVISQSYTMAIVGILTSLGNFRISARHVGC